MMPRLFSWQVAEKVGFLAGNRVGVGEIRLEVDRTG
jgi:hypothetical protein